MAEGGHDRDGQYHAELSELRGEEQASDKQDEVSGKEGHGRGTRA